MYKSRGDVIPIGYQSWYDRKPVKNIQRPIPGVYTDGAEDPTFSGPVMSEMFLTDEHGKVTFDDMRISTRGPAGSYSLGFICGGSLRTFSEHEIVVRSSIDPQQIQFAQKIPDTVYVNDLSKQGYDFIVIIEVLNSNQEGVSGKYPEEIQVTAFDPAYQESIEVLIAHEHDLFEPSEGDGIITIPIKVTKLTEPLRASLTFVIDDISIETRPVDFVKLESTNEKYISTIKFSDPPTQQFENGLEIGDSFDLDAYAYDLNGDVMDYTDMGFRLEVFFNPVTQAPARETIIVMEGAEYSIRRGEIRFRGNQITRAPRGHFYLRIHAYHLSNPEEIILSTDIIRFLMKVPFDGVLVTGIAVKESNNLFYSPKTLDYVNPRNLKESDIRAEFDTTYVLQLIPLNFADGPLKSHYVYHPPLEFEEFPPIMRGLEGGPNRFFNIHYLSRYTDEDGFFYVEFTIEYGGVGYYMISFDFGTGISIPFDFHTHNPVTSISILAEPDITNVPPDQEEPRAYYTGRPFNIYARVRIDVDIGPKDGYIVIVHPQSVDGNHASVEILPHSIYELNADKDNYIAWVSVFENNRIAITNSQGEADFKHLTVADVSGDSATVRFLFGAGDRIEGMYTVSEPTQSEYTFMQARSFEMVDQPSRHIAAFSPINPAPTVKMTSQILSPLNIMTVQLDTLFSADVNDSYDLTLTNRYISNAGCLAILSSSEVLYHSPECKVTPMRSFSQGAPYELEISVNELIWNTYGVNSMISLSFSTLMGHQSQHAAVSQRMSVENLAGNIVITQDPPEEVSINQVFVVETLVTVEGGFPLPNARVTCNVTKDLNVAEVSTEIFTSFANTEYNVQRNSLLAPGSRLDDKRSSAITNNRGVARLFLRVQESPIDSNVRIACQAGRAVTSPSSQIRVTHPVNRITQSEEYSETVRLEFNRDADGYLSTDVNLESTFKLDLHENANAQESIIRAQDLVIVVVPYEDLEFIRNAKDNVTDIFNSFNNFTNEESPIQEIIDLAITMVRGVQTVGSIQNQVSERNRATFERPEIDGFQATISNVTLTLARPGKYGLIFGANGIFTDLFTQNAQIEAIHEIGVVNRYFNLYHTAFLTVFYFLVLALASKMFKGYWMFISLAVVGGYLYLMSIRRDMEFFVLIVVYVLAGFIALYMLWAFLVYFVDTFIRKKNPGYFFDKKKQYFMEYVYQKLNGHPSNHWVNKRKNMKFKLQGLYNTQPKTHEEVEKLRTSSIRSLPGVNDSIERISQNDMTASFEIQREMSNSSIVSEKVNDYQSVIIVQDKLTKIELQNMKVDVTPYEKLGAIRKFLRILTPFELMYRRIWVNDCFVYPQLLLSCILICIISMAYLGYVMFGVIFTITERIEGLYSNVYDSVFNFLRNGIQRYFATMKVQATTTGLSDYFVHLENIHLTLDQLILAVQIGVIVGTTVAVVSVLTNLIWLLFDYKQRVLDARKGIFNFRKNKVSISMHIGISGAIISNSIFLFFVIIFFFTWLFSFLAWPLFWKILWRLRWNIGGIVLSFLINFIIKFILKKLSYNFDHVKRRWLLSMFDFFILQLAILAGIMSAISRLAILFFVLFVSVMRIDVTALPKWFADLIYLDSFNKSYYASILVQHYQNNPIMISFYELMFLITKPVNSNKEIDEEDREKINKRKIIRNRFHLWVFLTKNPSLIQYRTQPPAPVQDQEGEGEGEGDQEIPNHEEVADLEEAKTVPDSSNGHISNGDISVEPTPEKLKNDSYFNQSPIVEEVNEEDEDSISNNHFEPNINASTLGNLETRNKESDEDKSNEDSEEESKDKSD